jgi:hypothetical protein
MSNFNDANELASNLVFGTHYHNNEPREQGKPKQLVFTLTRKVVITAEAETQAEFAKVAEEIQDVLDEGYWLDLPNCNGHEFDRELDDETIPLDDVENL